MDKGIELDGGYRLLIGSDLKPRIFNKSGKELASVPPAVRKSDAYRRVGLLRKSNERRRRAHQRELVRWLTGGEVLPRDLFVALWPDPAWRAALEGALLRSLDGRAGLLVNAEAGKGIGLMTADFDTIWCVDGAFVVPHPATLPAELRGWRESLADSGVEQGTQQLLRRVVRASEHELALQASQRYSGRDLASAVRASYAFNALGWATARGAALYHYTVAADVDSARRAAAGSDDARDVPRRIHVAFEYFADGAYYGDWNMECHTGSLTFRDDSGEALRLREVPVALFSEACIDIESVLEKVER